MSDDFLQAVDKVPRSFVLASLKSSICTSEGTPPVFARCGLARTGLSGTGRQQVIEAWRTFLVR